MDDKFHRYNLITRLTHLAAFLLLIALYATGLRLAWFSGASPLFEPDSFFERILPTGQVYACHMVCGMLLLSCGLLYFVDLILTGQTGRLSALFTDKKRDYRKKLFYIFVLADSAVTIVSGVSLYMGSYEGAGGYMFMKSMHHYSMALLTILIVVHLIDVLLGKQTRLNAIFFGYLPERLFDLRRFIPAGLVAIVIGGSLWMSISSPVVLTSTLIKRQPTIDGRITEQMWAQSKSVRLQTATGANFDTGVSEVTIKSFHNSNSIFFLIQWRDDDRSFNRHLVKNDSGWSVQVSEYPNLFGETVYFEDKLALSFHRTSGGCASTCHLGTPGKMGLHYTDSDTADVWQWCAVSTNPIQQADDGWWATFDNDSQGGRHLDNLASGGYFDNLNTDWQQPYFLPVHAGVRHWIDPRFEQVTPYYGGEDSFSIGAQIPAVIVTQFRGDRGDVRAAGRWDNGRWTLELARPLRTGSSFDMDLRGECYMGVALFDNAASKHAFHLRPVKLVVE